MISGDKCKRGRNTLHDLFAKIFFPNKAKHAMKYKIESKLLIKFVSHKYIL